MEKEIKSRTQKKTKLIVQKPVKPKPKPLSNKMGLPITEAGSRLYTKYKDVAKYLRANPEMAFINFEYATGSDLNLCTFFQSAELTAINKVSEEIKRYLPFLINIFTKPVIHLKDNEVVLPVDAVKRVNHQTINHLAVHSEDWKKADARDVTPKRLLTRESVDDYGIYENVVFFNLIEKILNYLRKHIFHLTEVLDTLKAAVNFGDFGKLNHSMYYLAIGKLHVGFYKHDNSSEIAETLEDITKLYRLISSYKTRNVYAKNIHAKPIIGELKKTNILTMHKDYKHVYTLYQYMSARLIVAVKPGRTADQTRSQRYYEQFCQSLVLFAITHFNFKPDTSNIVYKKGKASAQFKFKRWTVTVSVKRKDTLGCNIIDLETTYRKNSVRYAIIPVSHYVSKNKRSEYEERLVKRLMKTKIPYDKFIFLEPYDYDHDTESPYDYSIRFLAGKPGAQKETHYAILPASITDVNSFRRIQRVLYESMTQTSKGRELCAFCGEALSVSGKNEHKLSCQKCRTNVYSVDCVNCKERFYTTYFDAPPNALQRNFDNAEYVKHMPEFFRQEIEHRFRNITKIKGDDPVCSHCDAENEL